MSTLWTLALCGVAFLVLVPIWLAGRWDEKFRRNSEEPE